MAFALAVLTLGCAGSQARPPAPPALDSTEAATAYAEAADDADLVVHVEVTTRVNDVLPHHMAQAQLAFINRSEAPITVPALASHALRIDGDTGPLPLKGAERTTPPPRETVTLAPGEMRVSYVDLLEIYEFPATGGRFRIHFDEPHLGERVHLRTNAQSFVLGARAL